VAHALVARAAKAQREWRRTKLSDRILLCNQFMAEFEKNKDQVARDITGQMGKPLNQSYNEINGMYARTKALIELAPEALADDVLPEKAGFFRKIVKEPVGVVLCLSPWNYPLLTAINTVIPAILAGNSVVIKHSPRTPLCASAFEKAFAAAGAPAGLVSSAVCDHDVVHELIGHPDVAFVGFTGSVQGGHAVYKTVSNRFIDCTLELGGKDPAYVAPDANIEAAVDTIVDGALYNSGQSCCAIERVYVHHSLYDEFISRAIPLLQSYKLGDPFVEGTTLGPMAQPDAPEFIHRQVQSAVRDGAKLIFGGKPTKVQGKGRFFEPTLLADTTQSMEVVAEETFGPVLPVCKVQSDEEALLRMNDSHYGLTAAVFTKDRQRVDRLAGELKAGTVFMNRCDFLDPELPWTGLKDTGKGVTLSKYGFRGVTKLKGYHYRL